VLFISIDDLNDWVGVLGGHPQAKTPNIDRLAQKGLVFNQAYCAAPICNASRVALLTGIPPHKSGVYQNKHSWRRVMPDVVTLPHLFKQNGYWVSGAGKIYHESFPECGGWDEYYGFNQVVGDKMQLGIFGREPIPPNIPINGIGALEKAFDWGELSVADEQMPDRKLTDWVRENLGKSYQQPFFFACGFSHPHLPWYVPQKYFEPFPLDEIQLPIIKQDDLNDIPSLGIKLAASERDHAAVIEHNQYRQAVQGYLASIYFVDTMIGRVLDALDASPYADNTIIVLWSDNGWHLGEKLHWRKGTLWEEATRIPLIFVVPKQTQAGSKCDRPVSLLDIYPTLIDLCGLSPTPPNLGGKSLLPLLENPNVAWDNPVLMTWQGHHSIRWQQLRYIRYTDETEELYDHKIDPLEWNNLAADSKYAQVKAQLAQWIPRENAPPAPIMDLLGC
jgi:arylsulfatase A-like enzyme